MENKDQTGVLRIKISFRAALVIAFCFGFSGFLESAFAKPPSWAPAHGYRAKKHKAPKVARPILLSKASVPSDIGLGSCNREGIGAVLGGVTGGILGSKIGKGDGKTIATIGGTLIGIFVGSSIGRSMDEADHYCVQHALEHAPNNKAVAWKNPDTGQDYRVTPKKGYNEGGQYCREYVVNSVVSGQSKKIYGTACRQADGSWRSAG